MANVNRIPLIVNSTANQIQELPTGDHLQLNDSNKLKIGNSGDLEIFHSSSNSILNDTGTGNLLLQIGGSTIVQTNPSGVVISGICTADSFSGKGITPIGGIIMWSGSVADISNLVGWELCDGSNGTPDLRNRFVVGAWSDGASAAWPNIPPGEADGNATITLSTSQLPSHRHLTFRSGNHGQLRNGSNLSSNNTPGSGSGASNLYEGYNINSSNSNANVGRSSAVGNGASINILPPYYGLAFIMKT